MRLAIVDQHFPHQFPQSDSVAPSQHPLRFARISLENVHFRGPVQFRINGHLLLVIQPHVSERQLYELPHRMSLPGGDCEIVRRRLLQYPPHSLHVFARMPPVALRFQVPQAQFLGSPRHDTRHPAVILRVTNSKPRRGDS